MAAAKFAMECQLLPTEQGLFTSVLYTLYRKDGTGVPSLNTVNERLLDEQNWEFAEIACN